MTAGPSLHVARDSTGVDIDAAERAAAGFLAALGIDVEHEDLQETPARMARAYAELFSQLAGAQRPAGRQAAQSVSFIALPTNQTGERK